MGRPSTVLKSGASPVPRYTLRSNPIIINQVLSNLVNYKSFGFTKFIPRIPKEKFEAVVKASSNATNALGTWESVRTRGRVDVRYRS